VREPIGEDCQVELPNIPNDIVFVPMILFEYMGIVNMADTILRREEGKNPDWYDMKNEK